MKLQDQVKLARNAMECEVKITKSLYKYIDSYQRREIWIGKQLIKSLMEKYGNSTASPTA